MAMSNCPSRCGCNLEVSATLALVAATLLLGVGIASAAPASPPTLRRFAIVVGADTAGSSGRLSKLTFAGTDARMNAEILVMAGYETQTLATGGSEPAATLENVLVAINRLVQEVSAGPAAEVIFWYSGHGDDNAFFLEDRPLTKKVLRHELLEPLQGKATVHLVIDACGALAFTTGWKNLPVVRVKGSDGDEPVVAADRMAEGLGLGSLPHVGVILGTTLEGRAIEFPSFRSGLLSYQLRAAILNGADASSLDDRARRDPSGVRDGRVTYREAEAFVWAANADIAHRDVRMFVWARGPNGRSQALLVNWAPAPSGAGLAPVVLRLTGDDQAHFWVAGPDADPGIPNVFHVNKGREQDRSLGVSFFLPRRKSYFFVIVGLGKKLVEPPSDGVLTWATIEQAPLFAKWKGDDDPREALKAGLFKTPYTIEVYWVYNRLKGTLGETNEVLLKMPGPEPGPGPNPPPARVGTAPWWLGGGAIAASLAGWAAWSRAESTYQQWEATEKGSTDYQQLRDRTVRWDRAATAGFITAGGLALAGGALLVYRLLADQPGESALAPALAPGSAGVAVTF